MTRSVLAVCTVRSLYEVPNFFAGRPKIETGFSKGDGGVPKFPFSDGFQAFITLSVSVCTIQLTFYVFRPHIRAE